MRNSKFTYQILIISVLLILMAVGVYIGLQASKPKEKSSDKEEAASVSTRDVVVYSENENKKLEDVEIIYVDIYKECGHVMQNKVIEYGSVFEDVKPVETGKATEAGYTVVKDTDNILMFERNVQSKCSDHYLIKLEAGKVVIYNIKEDGKYGKFEETEIYETSLREDYIIKLNKGIEANTSEELYMILEDMES